VNDLELMNILTDSENSDILNAVKQLVIKMHSEQERKEVKTVKIKQGLSLFRNSSSPSWWVRIKLPGKNTTDVRRSTKETSISEAKYTALLISTEVLKEYELGALDHKTMFSWNKICWEVIHILKAKAEQSKKIKPQEKTHATIIENYIVNFAAWNGKSILQIDYAELSLFSKSERYKEASQTFVNNTKKAFRLIFDHARENRYLREDQVPKLPQFLYVDGEEGKPFDLNDREAIFTNFENFYENSKNYITRSLRRQLPLYFNILCVTGLRTGEEPLGIQWSDLSQGQFTHSDGKKKIAYQAIIRKGKTSKETVKNKKKTQFSRPILLSALTVRTLEQLYYIRHSEKLSIDEIIKLRKNELIFIGNKGKKPNFASCFDQYLKYLHESVKEHYTLYSCRYEYINSELERGQSKDDVAMQVGNSVAVITKVYDKFRAMNRASRMLSEEDILAFNPEPEH
jgi:integrase